MSEMLSKDLIVYVSKSLSTLNVVGRINVTAYAEAGALKIGLAGATL
ncbi:MAG TPA: hypothetical protein V6C81_01660 [Planktothrix sp.]|jgi:hypothetical protein